MTDFIILKRCPFCGKDACAHEYEERKTHRAVVYCGNAECPVRPMTPCYEKLEEAVAAWNKRLQV